MAGGGKCSWPGGALSGISWDEGRVVDSLCLQDWNLSQRRKGSVHKDFHNPRKGVRVKDSANGDGKACAPLSVQKWKCCGQQCEGIDLMRVVSPKHMKVAPGA